MLLGRSRTHDRADGHGRTNGHSGLERPGVVLFVDGGSWDCLTQLALGIRRQGWRAVRIVIADNRRVKVRAWARRWQFDRTIVLASPDDLAALTDLLRAEQVVDLQCIDSLLGPVIQALGPSSGGALAEQWAARAQATDKVAVAAALRDHGVRVPDQLIEPTPDPEHVIATVGLPVMAKQRVGSGGVGVEIVETRERLDAIGRETSDGRFYERYVAGRAVQYSCFAGRNGIEAFVTYETLLRKSSCGPASLVRTMDDPQLAAVGEAVIKALDLHGFVDVNVIRDDLGQDWVHDVNPRVWGSFAVFCQLGVDFLGCYLDWLSCSARTGPPREAPSDTSVAVFPAGLGHAFTWKRRQTGGEPPSYWSWSYLRMLGFRYAAFELVDYGVDRVGRYLLRREPVWRGAPG